MALEWLRRELADPSASGVIVLPTDSELRSGHLTEFVGRSLKEDREFLLDVGAGARTVRAATTRTLGTTSAHAAVTLWLASDALRQVLDKVREIPILAVGYTSDDGYEYERRFGFVHVSGDSPFPQPR